MPSGFGRHTQACSFLAKYPDAPAEPLVEALKAAVMAAPKGPDRDVSRYVADAFLREQIENARAFVKRSRE